MPSVLLSFAEFLRNHEYTTSMWENHYTSNDVNQVCHHLTKWAQTAFGLDGEFLILWSRQEGMNFEGDSELCYLTDGTAYLLPNPFIEGDAEGFVVALQGILHNDVSDLYETPVVSRVLYNAV
ncbi:hypothetical protein [Alicyclobacillus sp. SO9]|uniref:hypothetical protein n=1 Tax=Alicyclobacillus sp. SO9 TaxID=2665646 RepID=UPI0018E703AF|nr:hypothetical protein [Alicyclobacillus sp. SO9]QQE77788.1 hypothetical protein GI364_17940 [Alicyclobacillus sp. SO9]